MSARASRVRFAPFALALVVTAAFGCYNTGAGQDPDDRNFYFPTGVALSRSGRFLFVVNSDFDLRFNSGTVQALDVDLIAAEAARCAPTPNAASCTSSNPARFVRAAVRIGAFASDLRAVPRYDGSGNLVAGGGRLLVPVRGDATVTVIDYDESGGDITLRCARGAQRNSIGGTCSNEWRIGGDPSKNSRQITLEGEPFGIAVPERWPDDASFEPRRSGGIAAVVHQSSGNVSVLVNANTAGEPPAMKVAFTLGGMAGGGTSIAALDLGDPKARFVPRFIVTNRTQSNVFVLSYFGDTAEIDRSGLSLSDVVPIPPQASGFDTRGIVVDPPGEGEDRPIRVFLTNRTPSALVVGEVDPRTQRLHFFENVPLPIGPSRIVRTQIKDEAGVMRSRLIAAAFDARFVVVYDPDARKVSNVVKVNRGPYAMTVNADKKLAFLCNFTDSTIQVMDLDPAKKGTEAFESIVFTVGVQSGPSR